jgi:3-oxoadipate enol-lactonase
LIVIPGIQGRWEWMAPALDELQRSCRTISYTLCGDIGSGMRFDPAAGFDNYIRQLDEVFARAGVDRAALCGVSYGGFIALRYAATRPERVSSLTLASSPAPGWMPSDRQRRYVERPWLSTPAFVATVPQRVWPEIRAAHETWSSRMAFSIRHAARVLAAPMIPSLMASRVTLQQGIDFAPDCARVKAPTLVVTGEEALDLVVPVEVTRRYQALIPGARYEQMERTGHLGMLTQPRRFAEIVSRFVIDVERTATADACRRRSG